MCFEWPFISDHGIHPKNRNVSDGDVLWKVAFQRTIDWQRSANDEVVGITRKVAKKFPCRG